MSAASSRRPGRPMRPRLRQRLVDIGRREQSRGGCDHPARQPARIAGPVQPLVMLDGDRANRRQRRGERKHPLAQVGVQADTLDLRRAERSRLVPDRVRNTQPPEIVNIRGPSQKRRLLRREADLVDHGGAQRGDACRVPHRPRRLQLGELTDRRQRLVDLVLAQLPGQRRLCVDHGRPARRRVQLLEQLRRSLTEELDKRRVELRAAALTRHTEGRLQTASALEHLDNVGEVHQPRRKRDLLALQLVRALPIPALVALPQALPYLVAQPKSGGELIRRAVVVLGQTLDRAPSVAEERDADPCALDQRPPRPADVLQHERGRLPRPAEVIAIVGVPLQRQVVAEPLRLLIRIRMTANPREQTRVVQRPAFAIVEPEPVRKTQRQKTRADHVLHRLPQPEIRPKRQQRDHLRETNLREPSCFHHDASLRTRRRRQHPFSAATGQRYT